QLGIRINRGPRPHIANAVLAAHFLWDVLLLAVDEAPDFIALDALARQVPQGLVLILRSGATNVHQQLGHGVDRAVREAGSGPEAGPFHQKAEDLSALCQREFVHSSRILLTA